MLVWFQVWAELEHCSVVTGLVRIGKNTPRRRGCTWPIENGDKTLLSEFEIIVFFLSTPVTEKFIWYFCLVQWVVIREGQALVKAICIMVAVLFGNVPGRDWKYTLFLHNGNPEFCFSANDLQTSLLIRRGWPPTSARQADAEEGLY